MTKDLLRISAAQGITLNAAGELPVPGTGAVYTGAFKVKNQPTSVAIKVLGITLSTLVSVRVQLEQGNALPAEAGAADTSWVVPELYPEGDAKDDVAENIDDETLHIIAYPPVATKYARLKITGLEGNGAATRISVLQITRRK